MKIKTDPEFTSFADGVCDVYSADETGKDVVRYAGLGFERRFLGLSRVFAARAAQVQINRVIRIPSLPGVDNHDLVEISGEGRYTIELVQLIADANPPCLDLTLRLLEMRRTPGG